jgi:hypothetical protein
LAQFSSIVFRSFSTSLVQNRPLPFWGFTHIAMGEGIKKKKDNFAATAA